MKKRLFNCFYSLLIFSIMIILSSCGGKDSIDLDADLGTSGGSTSGGGTGGGSTGGGTGSDLTTLWVYLPYTSAQTDSATHEEFDGSFNRPLPSLEAALTKVTTLASEGVTVDTINIYAGSSDASENVSIATSGLTISGGFYCVESDGAVIDMEHDYDDCEDIDQVKQDAVESVSDLSSDRLSLVKGTITISADVTLDQVSVEQASLSNGSIGEAAIVIKDSSPKIENALIWVPDGIKNSDGNSIAIYAEATTATTSPVISGNIITAGSPTTTGSNRFYGIRVDSNDTFTGVVSPQIKNNEIQIYDTSTISAGIMIVRDILADEENISKPVISQNTINMGEIPLSFGIYLTGTASQISKNKITVPGSSTTPTFLVSGIAINNLSDGVTETSKIYTNLITINSSQGSAAANGVLLQVNAEVYANTFVYTKGLDSTLPSAPVGINNNSYTPQVKIVSNIFMATQLATPKVIDDTNSSADMDDSLLLVTYNLIDVNFNDYKDYTEAGPTSVINNNIGESPGLDENDKPTSSSAALDKGYTFKEMGSFPPSGGSTIPRPGSEPLFGPSTDMDSHSRDYNDAADIGCYEYQGD